MMDYADEYNTQARTNPVFMTAKTAVCLMARAVAKILVQNGFTEISL